jgi:oligopeptide transport system substrate-binding protein
MSRAWFPLMLVVLALAGVAWAVLSVQLPPADFTFVNETEVATVDPALITGVPEGRICSALFEGLTRNRSDNLQPEPGIAESWEVSDDGRTYTFHLRPDAKWSNGDPITAHDFHYSLRRLLDPMTASRYAYLAWYIKNAKKYTSGGSGLAEGDPVEVELNPPADAPNTVRGELVHGKLVRIENNAAEVDGESSTRDRVFVVNVDGVDVDDKERRFHAADADAVLAPGVEPCRQVLFDSREVGIRVVDDHTFVTELENPTAYWLDLLAFYPLAPVNQKCLETHGAPAWTRPENIVTDGAYLLTERRLRDRIRLTRNPAYWDHGSVRTKVIDALSIDDRTTAVNLYLTGKADWVTVQPPVVLRAMLAKDPPPNDVKPAPQLTTYYYMVNTTRKPVDDVRVRKALALSLDREEITRVVTAAGEVPAFSLIPPSMPSYKGQPLPDRNPELARKLLAEAGFPGGRGFPKLEIHYNNDQGHQAVAELARKQWQRELGINVTLRNEEWASAQNSQQQMNYMLSRRSWTGDYLDPNTYLDLFVTGGENNSTGFSNAEYDKLIADAAREPDEAKRMQMLERAERILMDELPIIPIYFYVSKNLVRPYVRGWYNNLQDMHPLNTIWIDHSVDVNAPQPNEYSREQQ